jgi:hypothetical protein
VAVLLALLCGIMAPMLNYAFAFGQDLAVEAVRLGSSPVAAAYAVWPVALLGGLVPNVSYSVYLLQRNSTWAAFGENCPDVFWPALMGVLWMGAFALYGMSAVHLGVLGTSIGAVSDIHDHDGDDFWIIDGRMDRRPTEGDGIARSRYGRSSRSDSASII